MQIQLVLHGWHDIRAEYILPCSPSTTAQKSSGIRSVQLVLLLYVDFLEARDVSLAHFFVISRILVLQHGDLVAVKFDHFPAVANGRIVCSIIQMDFRFAEQKCMKKEILQSVFKQMV